MVKHQAALPKVPDYFWDDWRKKVSFSLIFCRAATSSVGAMVLPGSSFCVTFVSSTKHTALLPVINCHVVPPHRSACSTRRALTTRPAW